MTLPTREEAQAWIDFWHGSRAKIREFMEADIMAARASGELQTRAEWEAGIDRQAIRDTIIENDGASYDYLTDRIMAVLARKEMT